jgi:hypothetical protein
MSGVALLQFIAAQGVGAQVDAAEAAFGPLEFGGTMYKFAIPIISLAFLMMLGEQFLSMRAGQKPDWGRPFVRTAGFILLLTAYGPFSSGIIGAVQMAGSIDSAFSDVTSGTGENSTSGVLAKRAKEFQELRARIADEMKTAGTTNSDRIIPTAEDIALVAESFMTSVIDDLLYVATWFTFTFAAFAVFAIKTLSGAITNILLEVGPLMIAFAALPGLTTRYLAAWCMALIEVTAWGPIAGIILSLLARVNAKSAGVAILEDANYAEHIVLNFVYAGLFLAVPAITHMILSGTASSVGSTGMAAAMGGLAAAGKTGAKAAGAAVDGGAAAGKAALQATGSAADKAATRIGDAATGGATQGTMDAASRQMASAMVGNDVADQKQDARDLHAKRGAIEKQRRGDG